MDASLVKTFSIASPRRFTASSAELKSSWGWTYAGTAVLRDHQIQLDAYLNTQQKNMTISQLTNSINPATAGRALLIPLVLVCFAFWPAPNAFGVLPAPDGGYPAHNTAEGTDALVSLTIGINNTANGYNSLYSNTAGPANTAIGSATLF